jgi:hypothetical protein
MLALELFREGIIVASSEMRRCALGEHDAAIGSISSMAQVTGVFASTRDKI